MQNKALLLTCLSLSILNSCGPTIKAERVSTEKGDKLAGDITDQWLVTDTEMAVKDILNQIQNHRGFQQYLARLGRSPKVFIGEVQNDTSEAYFPIGDLNDELLNDFSASGDFILIDAAARDKILQEITYQNNGMVSPEQIKSIGKQSGADLIIFGSVHMVPQTMRGKTLKEYSVNLRMTNIETGEEVLRTRFKTSKYSQRKKHSW